MIPEIGPDLPRWPTVKHFASWLRLAPGTKIAGGRIPDRRTPSGAPRAAALLRQAASTIGRSNTPMGAFYRRIAARSGPAVAVVATAHKLARPIYALLTTGRPYQPTSIHDYDRQQRQRITRSVERRAKDLGYRLAPLPLSPAQQPSVS